MLCKDIFLVLLLIPLFLAAQESQEPLEGEQKPEEEIPAVNGSQPEESPETPESPAPPASSDANSAASESTTSTTSGTSRINWTNSLVLTLVILLKQL